MRKTKYFTFFLILVFAVGIAIAATIVPSTIDQPGTQPGEIGNLSGPDRCDNCHGGYNTSVEPAFNWRGSMMANAGRDPIFWGTLAVVEQGFDGAGDLCIRCHSTAGWLAGRSTPTDGSGLGTGDSDGVECDFCHKMTNPANLVDDPVNFEWAGVQIAPFIANDGGTPAIGYYGSGMSSMWGGSDMLGPYSETNAKHQFLKSKFHRDRKFCGTCHDVSNPGVGNLAHNFGAQDAFLAAFPDPIADGSPNENPKNYSQKAAFNNFPYMYGIVERTFSEYMSSQVPYTLVDEFTNLPADLQGGALLAMYNAATKNGNLPTANYEDGESRFYTCQTCHMRPVTGQGCNKNPLVRDDLPLHDMTGGNYWMPEVIKYLDIQGKLRLGGGLTATQLAALDAGALRAKEQLDLAATLSVQGNSVKIINHTGHKLISGYPEGRRMWLNIKWYDADDILLREDGEYGPLFDPNSGSPIMDPLTGAIQVESIKDLHDPNTKIYEAHYGMTQEWAGQLITLGYPGTLALSFNRYDPANVFTLAELTAQAPGTYHETFHFVLNNKVVKDNRIPPYGMSYNKAQERNALPVPENQYGGGPGKTYEYFDTFHLNAPQGAASATIELLYQPTSYEYQLFLLKANSKGIPFLAQEGDYMFEAWLNNGMAAPYVMASATWHDPIIGDELAADFGANGLWHYDGSTWSKMTSWNPASGGIAGWNGGLAADFSTNGLWNYDGTTWSRLTTWNPDTDIAGWNGGLAADFGINGVWNYNGTTWSRLTIWDPDTDMAGWAGGLAADFGANGVWNYNGTTWSRLTTWDAGSAGMAGWADGLAADFGINGVWNYNGTTWNRLTIWDAGSGGMAGWFGGLAVDFGASGLWNYNGTTWSRLTYSDPITISALGHGLAASFPLYGVGYYDGTTWSRLTTWSAADLTDVDLY